MLLENIEGLKDYIIVAAKCDECGTEYRTRINTSKSQVEIVGHHQCRKCVSRRAGKKTGAKMREVYRERWLGNGNPNKIPKLRAKITASQTGVPFSEERKKTLRVPKKFTEKIKEAANRPEERERRSKLMSKRISEGSYHLTGDCGFCSNAKTLNPIWCRSKLEVKFLDRINDCEIVKKVSSAEYLEIPYYADGNKRRYLPDFMVELIDGSVIIVEVKGSCFLKGVSFFSKKANTNEKIQALRKECLNKGWGIAMVTERTMHKWLEALRENLPEAKNWLGTLSVKETTIS